jgi:uncharacterized protein with PIN domain
MDTNLTRAHGLVGHVITDDEVDAPAMVYVAEELRARCEECGEPLRVTGRFNAMAETYIGPHTVLQCPKCGLGILSPDGGSD